MADTEEMPCRELVELITEYLEETLSSKQRNRFEAHLNTCDGCQTYLKQMQTTIGLVGKLKEEMLPPTVKDDLLRAFRGWK